MDPRSDMALKSYDPAVLTCTVNDTPPMVPPVAAVLVIVPDPPKTITVVPLHDPVVSASV